MTGVYVLECSSCLLIQLLLLFFSIGKLLTRIFLIGNFLFFFPFRINLLLLKEGREEDVIHVVLFEVLGPVFSQLLSKVVGLVDQQQELLGASVFAHIFNVLLQI